MAWNRWTMKGIHLKLVAMCIYARTCNKSHLYAFPQLEFIAYTVKYDALAVIVKISLTVYRRLTETSFDPKSIRSENSFSMETSMSRRYRGFWCYWKFLLWKKANDWYNFENWIYCLDRHVKKWRKNCEMYYCIPFYTPI